MVKKYQIILLLTVLVGISYTLANVSSSQIELVSPTGGALYNLSTDAFFWNVTAGATTGTVNCSLHGNWTGWLIPQNDIFVNASNNLTHNITPLSYAAFTHGKTYIWGMKCQNITDTLDNNWSNNASFLYYDSSVRIDVLLDLPANESVESENVSLWYNVTTNLANGMRVNCTLYVNETQTYFWGNIFINDTTTYYTNYSLNSLTNQSYNWSVECIDAKFGIETNHTDPRYFYVNLSDTVPPSITGFWNYTTNTSITINWTTDKLANATVYMNGSALPNSTFLQSFVQHRTGLTPDIWYYFNITSCNQDSYCSVTGPYYVRTNATVDTTPPVLVAISNYTTNSTITINWTTNELTNATIDSNATPWINSTYNSSHIQHLVGLPSDTTYYFNITACDNATNCANLGYYLITTNATTDTTAALINSISNITANSSVELTINKDEAANITLSYGTSSTVFSYNTSNSTKVQTHVINISNLINATQYFFNVTLYNLVGNRSEYGPYHFTTNITIDVTAPVLLMMNNVTTNSTIAIAVTTDDDHNLTVNSNASDQTNSSFQAVTYQYRSGLAADTDYEFNLTLCNAEGYCGIEGPFIITTNATVDTSAPTLSSISNTTTNSTITLTWTVNELSNATVEINSTPYKNVSTATTFVHHRTGLFANTTYIFNITNCNLVGNCSNFGPYLIRTAATTDVTAAVINTIANTTTNDSIAVMITLDEPANATVWWGTNPSVFTNHTYNSSSGTSHGFNMTGLQNNVTYYFNFTLFNLVGNRSEYGPYNVKTNATDDTTPPTFVSIGNVTWNTTIKVTWTLNENVNATGWSNGTLSTNSTFDTTVVQYWTGLTPNTTYSFNLSACNEAGLCAGPFGPFLIRTLATADTTFPWLTNIVNASTNTTAEINISMSEMVNTSLKWGSTAALLSIPQLNATLTNSHTFRLFGLTPSSPYFYNVTICDTGNNCNETGPFIFFTTATPDLSPPIISAIDNQTTNSSATINWTTSENSNYTVNWGSTAALGTLNKSAGFASPNSVALNGLASNTSYYLNITSCDAQDNCLEYGPYQVRTNATMDLIPPVVSAVSPANNHYSTVSNTLLYFNATDEAASTLTCYLIINSTVLNTRSASSGVVSSINATLGNGNHSWHVVCNDGNNNASSSPRIVGVDTANPGITYSPAATPGANSWYISTATITIIASDNESAINLTEYSINGSTWYQYSSPFVVGNDNSTIYFRTFDMAGNTASGTASFNIDTSAPSLSITPGQTIYANQVATFGVNGTDGQSGIASYKITRAGSVINQITTTSTGTSISFDPDYDGNYMINTNAMGNRTFNISVCNTAGVCTNLPSWVQVYNIFSHLEFDNIITSYNAGDTINITVNTSNNGNINANATLHFKFYKNNFNSANLKHSYSRTVQVNQGTSQLINYTAWSTSTSGIYLVKVFGMMVNTLSKPTPEINSPLINIAGQSDLFVSPNQIDITVFANRTAHKLVYVSNRGGTALGAINYNTTNGTVVRFSDMGATPGLSPQSFVNKVLIINTTGIAGSQSELIQVYSGGQVQNITVSVNVLSANRALLIPSVDEVTLSSNITDTVGAVILNLTNIGNADATNIRIRELVNKQWISTNYTSIGAIAVNNTASIAINLLQNIIGNLSNRIIVTYNNSGTPTWSNISLNIPLNFHVEPTDMEIAGNSVGYNSTFHGTISMVDSETNDSILSDTTLEDSNATHSTHNRSILLRAITLNSNSTDSELTDTTLNESVVSNSTIIGSIIHNLTIRNANISNDNMYSGEFENNRIIVRTTDEDVSISVQHSDDNTTNITSLTSTVSGTGIALRLDTEMLDTIQTDITPDSLEDAMNNLSSQTTSNYNETLAPALVANASMDIAYNGTNDTGPGYNATYTLTNTSAKGHALIAIPIRSTVFDQSAIVAKMKIENGSTITLGNNDFTSRFGYYYIDDSLLMIYVQVDPVISLYLPKASSPPPNNPGGGSGGGGSSRTSCTPAWDCTEWSVCGLTGFQTRTCTDTNNCAGIQPPITSKTCTASTPAEPVKEVPETVEEEVEEASPEPEDEILEPAVEIENEPVPFLQKTKKYSPYAISIFALIAGVAIILSLLESRKTRI